MLLCLSSALPGPAPRLLSLSSGLLHDATVPLGRRVLRLFTCHLSCHVFRPTSIPLRSSPVSLSPPPSYLFLSPFSLPFSHQYLHSFSFPYFPFFPSPQPSPLPHLFPSLFLPSCPWCPVFPLISNRRVDAGSYVRSCWLLQAPPPVYRDDAACEMTVPGLLLYFFPDVADI